MNYSNYRNNMPHYDSMTYSYEPMGVNDYRVTQNSRMRIANTMPTMPGMPEDMFNLRPFIPDTEIPFEVDGDMPALPRMPGMPGMPAMSCEQLREMMRRMNCPTSGNGTNGTNGQRPVTPRNGTATPPANNNR